MDACFLASAVRHEIVHRIPRRDIVECHVEISDSVDSFDCCSLHILDHVYTLVRDEILSSEPDPNFHRGQRAYKRLDVQNYCCVLDLFRLIGTRQLQGIEVDVEGAAYADRHPFLGMDCCLPLPGTMVDANTVEHVVHC
jgi:hypothetical protein